MRNLKRALSLALAMVMVLSMMVIGAGAAGYAKDGLTSADMDDSLFVTDILRKTSDYTDVYAFVAGSAELQEIKVDGRDVTDGQAYIFEINSDGYYELTELTVGESGVNGNATVTSAGSRTFVLDRNDAEGNNEYEITSDTLLVDYSDYLDDPTGELGAGPSEDDHISWVTYNSDDEAIMVVIWNPEVDDGAEETTDADSVVSAGSGNNIGTVADVLGAESVNENLAEDLKAGMSDVTVEMDGSTVSIGGTIGYTEGLDGFNTTKPEENNGYYAILQVRVPTDLENVTHYQTWKADWGTAGEWSTNAELDGTNYFILVLRLDDGGSTPSDLQVQWTDADGDVIGTSTVKFDISGLTFG